VNLLYLVQHCSLHQIINLCSMKINYNNMKKYLILFLLFLIQIECIAQYSRVYESYRKNINRIAEGIFSDIIEDEQGKAYFGSVAWSLDPKQLYSYTFLSKVDKEGSG
jgi:hypothetical protein